VLHRHRPLQTGAVGERPSPQSMVVVTAVPARHAACLVGAASPSQTAPNPTARGHFRSGAPERFIWSDSNGPVPAADFVQSPAVSRLARFRVGCPEPEGWGWVGGRAVCRQREQSWIRRRVQQRPSREGGWAGRRGCASAPRPTPRSRTCARKGNNCSNKG